MQIAPVAEKRRGKVLSYYRERDDLRQDELEKAD
jgi:hypothetical protein